MTITMNKERTNINENSGMVDVKVTCWFTSVKFTVIDPDEGEASQPVGRVIEKAQTPFATLNTMESEVELFVSALKVTFQLVPEGKPDWMDDTE